VSLLRLVALSRDLAGQRLARSVTNVFGQVLLRAGTTLTPRYIDNLIERGYGRVYVEDAISADIVTQDDLSLQVQTDAARALRAAIRSGTPGRGRVAALERAVASLVTELRTSPALAAELVALRATCDYAFTHAVNVCTHALGMGHAVGLGPADLTVLGVGALLQDVGALAYADIWNRPGPLTPEEYERLKRHTADGYEIVLHGLRYDLRAAHMAFQHHERLDGSGYPRGLRGGQVLVFARIGAVADTFDALCSRRPHRQSLPPHVAMRLLKGMAGHQLDGELVYRFSERACVYPTGATVLLDTGEVALVAAQAEDGGPWPRVRILTDPQQHLVVPFEVDLSPGSPARHVKRVLPGLPAAVRQRLAQAS
jgi:HD-GYP domain-containing protein (c-di-GMP phosphodiesterase class II)